MSTTFRKDVRAGLVTLLQAFKTANPTMAGDVLSARPENFTGDYPIAFVDSVPESASHSVGVRTRLMSPTIVFVTEESLNAQEMDAFDLLVDAFMDKLTATPHIVTGTIWDAVTLEDYTEEIGSPPATRPAVRFTIVNLSIGEGRSP